MGCEKQEATLPRYDVRDSRQRTGHLLDNQGAAPDDVGMLSQETRDSILSRLLRHGKHSLITDAIMGLRQLLQAECLPDAVHMS